MKKIIFVTMIILSALHLCGQGYRPNYVPLHSGTFVQDKNFYLFTLFQKKPLIKQALERDTLISGLWKRKRNHLTNDSTVQRFAFTSNEIDKVGSELKKLAAQPVFRQLIGHDIRASGYYLIYQGKTDAELLETAWREATTGVNHIIAVFATAEKPLYPDIDSVSYNVRSSIYKRLMGIIALQTIQHLNTNQFFEPSLNFALSLLEVNNRDEAGRFEPLEQTENRAAVSYISQIDWKKYPYTAIIVPGAGNDLPNVRIAAWGKMRLKIAVERYLDHKAPLIIVSGGYVHPFQTPYCEAFEMKSYLMQHYHIPAKAILIEPHARHTSTNVRNANRLIYKYHIPIAKKALIVTDQTQSIYIEDPKFGERCLKEMKCVPFKNMKRISIYDLEYTPDISSLYYDNIDPLDP